MKDTIQAALKLEFDTNLSEGVKTIVFKNFVTQVYSASLGSVVRIDGPDLETRGLVNQFSMQEINKSDGTITDQDLKVTVIENEITRPPVVNDMCIINSIEYRVRRCHPDAVGASYLLHLVVN